MEYKIFILILFSLIGRKTLASYSCPRECFCDGNNSISCIGDSLSVFPTFDQSINFSRIQIHDYLLRNLILDRWIFDITDELILTQNQISRFSLVGDRFLNPCRLNHLDLSNNNLTQFTSSGSEFQCLRILDLSHNQIVNLSLLFLRNLESLNLRANQITSLPQNTFQSLSSIQYLNLDGNNLKYIHPNLFSNLNFLAHLILSGNPLQLPPGYIFNSKTQFLDISHTGVSSIPQSLYTTIRDIRINNNNISKILRTDFESYPNLGLILLDTNAIIDIEEDAFERLEFLNSLWINSNRLTRIPTNLPQSLQSLQLEENLITFLNGSDFNSVPNLQNLNLHGNKLSNLDPFVFSSLSSLQILNLRANQIDSILGNTFYNLSSLKNLDLSQNPLKVIVNYAFYPLTNLQSLLLSRLLDNNPEFGTELLSTNFKLTHIDISNSYKIAKRILIGISTLDSIREIHIENCKVSLSEIKVMCDGSVETWHSKWIKGSGNPFVKNITTTIQGQRNEFTLSEICGESERFTLVYTTSTELLTLPTTTPSTSTISTQKVELSKDEHLNSKNISTIPTSSYFPPSSSSSSGFSSSEKKRQRGNEEEKKKGLIHGFTQYKSQENSTNIQENPRILPLQSSSSSGSDENGSQMDKSLILKTILVSGLVCMGTLILVLGIGIYLFKIKRNKLSVTSNRSSSPSSYHRLEENPEIGILNSMYYIAQENQVFHIT